MTPTENVKFTKEESLELVKWYCKYRGNWYRLMHCPDSAYLFVGRTKKYAQSHISSIKTQVGHKYTTRRATFVHDSIVHHVFDDNPISDEEPPLKTVHLNEKQQLLMWTAEQFLGVLHSYYLRSADDYIQYVAEEEERSAIRRENILAKQQEKWEMMNWIRQQEKEKEEYMDTQVIAITHSIRQGNMFLHAINRSQEREKKLLKLYKLQKKINKIQSKFNQVVTDHYFTRPETWLVMIGQVKLTIWMLSSSWLATDRWYKPLIIPRSLILTVKNLIEYRISSLCSIYWVCQNPSNIQPSHQGWLVQFNRKHYSYCIA